MKTANLIQSVLFTLLAFVSLTLNAQTVYNPSSYTNAKEITIKRISVTANTTIVDMTFNTAYNNQKFFFNPNMYIQAAGNNYATKYYVRQVLDGALNQWMSPNSRTDYNYTLVFDRIPSSLSKIDIIEPSGEYTGWHWRGIEMYNPTGRKLPLDEFFSNYGVSIVANMAHPTNTFKYANWKVDEDKVWLDIYYEGYNTEIEITTTNGMFTSIRRLADDDIVEPFTAVGLLKDFAVSQSNQSNSSTTALEAYLQKRINDMTGRDLTCLALTCSLAIHQ